LESKKCQQLQEEVVQLELKSSTLGLVLGLMSLKKFCIELELLDVLPVTPVEVGEALQDEQDLVVYV